MVHVRPISDSELRPFIAMLEATAGRRLSSEALDDLMQTYDLERLLGAYDGDILIGGTGSERLEITLPGPFPVAVNRITHTGVIPTHRDGRVALTLLGDQIRRLRSMGETLAVFTTSGPAVYRPIGYSPASWVMEVELDIGGPFPSMRREDCHLEVIGAESIPGELPEIYDHHRRVQSGQMQRSEGFWSIWARDRPQYRPYGSSERFGVLARDPSGRPQGYLTYRLVAGPDRDQPIDTLLLEDLVALNSAAARELRKFCLRFRQARQLRALQMPLDDPLPWMLPNPRQLRSLRTRDFLWLRILRLEAALEARQYGCSDEIVIGVHDPILPVNCGRYRLSTDGARAKCERTESSADLELSVSELATVLLGGFSLSALAVAGLVTEHTESALARADRLFRTALLPWTASAW